MNSNIDNHDNPKKLFELPVDIVTNILLFTQLSDIESLLRTCKSIQNLIKLLYTIITDKEYYDIGIFKNIYDYNLTEALNDQNLSRLNGDILVVIDDIQESEDDLLLFIQKKLTKWSRYYILINSTFDLDSDHHGQYECNDFSFCKHLDKVSKEIGTLKTLNMPNAHELRLKSSPITLVPFNLPNIKYLELNMCQITTSTDTSEISGNENKPIILFEQLKSLRVCSKDFSDIIDILGGICLPKTVLIMPPLQKRSFAVRTFPEDELIPQILNGDVILESLQLNCKLKRLYWSHHQVGALKNFNFPHLDNLHISFCNPVMSEIKNFKAQNLTSIKIKVNSRQLVLKNIDLPNLEEMTISCESISENSGNINCPNLNTAHIALEVQRYDIEFIEELFNVKSRDNWFALHLEGDNFEIKPDTKEFKNLRNLRIEGQGNLHEDIRYIKAPRLKEKSYFVKDENRTEFPMSLSKMGLTELKLDIPLGSIHQKHVKGFTSLTKLFLKDLGASEILGLNLPQLKELEICFQADAGTPVLCDCAPFNSLEWLKLYKRGFGRLNFNDWSVMKIDAPNLIRLDLPGLSFKTFDTARFPNLEDFLAPTSQKLIIRESNRLKRIWCTYQPYDRLGRNREYCIGKLPKLELFNIYMVDCNHMKSEIYEWLEINHRGKVTESSVLRTQGIESFADGVDEIDKIVFGKKKRAESEAQGNTGDGSVLSIVQNLFV